MRTLFFFRRSSSLWQKRRDQPHFILSSKSFCTDNGDDLQSSKVKIFDRHLKRRQRDRAAWLMRPKDSFVDATAENILDRLEDCKRSFTSALCLGGSLEAIRRLLNGRGGIEKLVMMDTSYDMVRLCKDAEQNEPSKKIETSFMVGDEEFLPVKERSDYKLLGPPLDK